MQIKNYKKRISHIPTKLFTNGIAATNGIKAEKPKKKRKFFFFVWKVLFITAFFITLLFICRCGCSSSPFRPLRVSEGKRIRRTHKPKFKHYATWIVFLYQHEMRPILSHTWKRSDDAVKKFGVSNKSHSVYVKSFWHFHMKKWERIIRIFGWYDSSFWLSQTLVHLNWNGNSSTISSFFLRKSSFTSLIKKRVESTVLICDTLARCDLVTRRQMSCLGTEKSSNFTTFLD